MSPATTTIVKKTTRARKTAPVSEQVLPDTTLSSNLYSKALKPLEDAFAKLVTTITTAKEDYETLQKQIAEVKESWEKEQRLQAIKVQEKDQQEEVERRREQELYNYETALKRRQAEDEFAEKKIRWEKELAERKEEIAKDKEELGSLRKQVAGFETQLVKAVKEATDDLEENLNDSFATERKMNDQEEKSEKELLAFKITNLTQENLRQAQEIALLKKSLENATVQLKDVAVKVIESSSNKPQVNLTQES